jgi:6-pyruvoyltetrahydropterin/6-carboxytetrahydropterin synthase
MYELTVEATFSAAHAILIAGEREPLHGHDWHVTACVAGETLDPEGLLIDFHALEESLSAILRPFRNANLNDAPPFDRTNPTAENVARFIALSLAERARMPGEGGRNTRVAWVRVTEAPGCAVTYRL